MATIGEQFRSAREHKRVSLSKAAASTHIKIQHLEAMESDDFSRMPAPAYAKGFIKLYAEYLGLEPAPLIEEYQARHIGINPPSYNEKPEEPAESLHKSIRDIIHRLRNIPRAQVLRIASVCAIIVLLLLFFAGVRKLADIFSNESEEDAASGPAKLQFVEAVPEPYIDGAP